MPKSEIYRYIAKIDLYGIQYITEYIYIHIVPTFTFYGGKNLYCEPKYEFNRVRSILCTLLRKYIHLYIIAHTLSFWETDTGCY